VAQVIASEQPTAVADIAGYGVRMKAAYEDIQFLIELWWNIKPSLQV